MSGCFFIIDVDFLGSAFYLFQTAFYFKKQKQKHSKQKAFSDKAKSKSSRLITKQLKKHFRHFAFRFQIGVADFIISIETAQATRRNKGGPAGYITRPPFSSSNKGRNRAQRCEPLWTSLTAVVKDKSNNSPSISTDRPDRLCCYSNETYSILSQLLCW